jgi:NAD-dependent DNA ligase
MNLRLIEHNRYKKKIEPVKAERVTDRRGNWIEDSTVCVTGRFDCGRRDFIHNMIEDLGGVVASRISLLTHYLIVANKEWGRTTMTSKRTKAIEYGIPMVKEDEFVEMYKEHMEFDCSDEDD